MTHSKITQRRLNDGQEALEASIGPRTDLAGLLEYRDTLHAGIAALQSLDDLGSDDANKKSWDDMLALQYRYDVVVDRIKRMKDFYNE